MTLTMKRMPIGFTLGEFSLCTGLVTTMRAGEHWKEAGRALSPRGGFSGDAQRFHQRDSLIRW